MSTVYGQYSIPHARTCLNYTYHVPSRAPYKLNFDLRCRVEQIFMGGVDRTEHAGNDARQDNAAAPSANILHHSIGQFRHLFLFWR